MGNSADAYIIYGVDLGEELPENIITDSCEDFDEWLCHLAGMPSYGGPAFTWQKREAFLAVHPLKMILYSTFDTPQYILGLRSTFQETDWGESVEVKMDNNPAEKALLEAFLLKYGIHEKPKWLLSAFFG